MPDENVKDNMEIVQQVIEVARKCAFDRERTNLAPCLSRSETKRFMNQYRITTVDIYNMLSNLRIEEYSYTSKKTGERDAYVFGPNTREDYKAYLKFQICDGILVISFHEPDRELEFPYRARRRP